MYYNINKLKEKKIHNMIWKITGRNLKDVFIEADSFDEAIEKARKINPGYNGGQVIYENKD